MLQDLPGPTSPYLPDSLPLWTPGLGLTWMVLHTYVAPTLQRSVLVLIGVKAQDSNAQGGFYM